MGKNSFGKPAVTDVSVARRIAYKVLRHLDEKPECDSRDLIRVLIQKNKVDEADERLAVTLVLGCLRYRMRLDGVIRKFLVKPQQKLLPFIQTILRMVAYQQFYLDRLPPHAICNEAVGLVALEGYGADNRLRGFVNAVSRKIVEMDRPLEPENIFEAYSLPSWLGGVFKVRFGKQNLLHLFEGINQEPSVVLRVNTRLCSLKQAADILNENEIEFERGKLVNDAFVLLHSSKLLRLLKLPAFEQGYFYIQDEASQYVSIKAAPRSGEKVLDLCAAPGGKTGHLAELSFGMSEIVATDINARRLALLKENLERLGTTDVRVLPWQEVMQSSHFAQYDLVLVDAPCSGIGTIRRNPEIKWRLQYEDIVRLSEMQYDLLCTASQFVRKGGRIVYSTCSVTTQENKDVIDRFLNSHINWTFNESKSFCSWPQLTCVDGFTINELQLLQC